MNHLISSVLKIGVAWAAVGAQARPAHSQLWGAAGEKWEAGGRLPDFSFAGYRFGEDPLPEAEVVANVREFGAEGDGKTDDTRAFRDAIATTQRGAILIPAGVYILSDILWIEKPGLVLRGEGQGKTVLRFVTQLQDVLPNMSATTEGRPTSNYSWSGGFIWVKGSYQTRPMAEVASNARRGARTFTVDRVDELEVGQRVWLEVRDDADKTLVSHLYSGDPGNTDRITKPMKFHMVSRIESIDGREVTLERPLRFDLRAEWSPRLMRFAPTVTEVGIEELTIDFPVRPYGGHFTEWGMNGIAMNGVSDCWVRNVHISNADSGVFLYGDFCTIDGLVMDSLRPPAGAFTGHHGVTLGTDCLLTDFDFRTRFIHDVSVDDRSAGNVTKNGRGVDLTLDHHKRVPHENLFCNLHAGAGSEVWKSGGGHDLGRHCAARGTFWGIDADADLPSPPASFGPASMNFVGFRFAETHPTEAAGPWFEAIAPDQLEPADLHAAQLRRRLESRPKDR